MSEDEIEYILAEFRGWLREQGDVPETKPLDLLAVVDEFTALRHEVKLLTKAARGQSEQMAAIAEKLDFEPAKADDEPSDDLKAALLGMIDAVDTLERAYSATKAAARAAAAATWNPFRRHRPDKRLQANAEGLLLSCNRLKGTIERLGCEPVGQSDEPFDPETMEALEAVPVAGMETGTVVNVERPGYLWRGKVLRYAQVRVAK